MLLLLVGRGEGLISVILKMCTAKLIVFLLVFYFFFFNWILKMHPKKLFVCVGYLAHFSSVGCFCIYETRLSHLSTFPSTV